MAAAAETLGTGFEPTSYQNTAKGVLLAAHEASEQASIGRAEVLIRSAGSAALSETVERPKSSRAESLMDAIHQAAEGDPGAYEQVAINVRKDVVERTIKSGHITSVSVQADEYGKLYQYGQYIEDVQKNALRFASDHSVIRARTEAETRNSMRIEDKNRDGTLDDYYMVVFSRCDDSLPDDELSELGFFTDTKSCAIQATTASGEGVITESAFVAGAASPGAPRHDQKAVKMLAGRFELDYSNKTPAEIIDAPLLIPKELMPNGVIDLVKLYDECAGGTFFGEAKASQDYGQYLAYCQEREETFEPLVQKIARELTRESQWIRTQLAATERLHILSQETMLNHAVEDTTINPNVFGRESAMHIAEARAYIEQGLIQEAMRSISNAQKTAVSSSCPSAPKKDSTEDEAGDLDKNEIKNSKADKTMKCVNCPKCSTHHTEVKPQGGKYRCKNTKCGYEVRA